MAFFPPFFPKASEPSTPTIRPKYILFKTSKFAQARQAFELNSRGTNLKINDCGKLDIPWADDYAVLPWVTDTQLIKSSSTVLNQTQGGYANQKRLPLNGKTGGFVTGSWLIAGEVTPIPYSDSHIQSLATRGSDPRNPLPLIFQVIQQAMNLMDEVEADPNSQLVLYSLQEGEYWYVQPINRTFYRRQPDRVGWRYEFTFDLLEKAQPPSLSLTALKITEKKDWFEKLMDALNKGLKYIRAAIAWCQAVIKKIGQYINRILAVLQSIADAWQSIAGMISTILSAPEALFQWAKGWVQTFIDGYNEIKDSFNDMVSFFSNFTDFWDFSDNNGSDDSDSGDISPSINSIFITEMQEYINGIGAATDEAIIGLRMGLSETIRGRASRIIDIGDTLESIALEIYGDKSYAMKIAEWNNLKPPYFSNSGIPGTLRPGQVLYYPYSLTGAIGTIAPIDGVYEGDVTELLYGRGVRLIQTEGHPWRGDIKVASDRMGTEEIYGTDCVEQALWIRMQTTFGKDGNFPYVGLPDSIGQITDPTTQAMINAATSWQIRSDNRIESIKSLDISDSGEALNIQGSVGLILSAEQASVGVTI